VIYRVVLAYIQTFTFNTIGTAKEFVMYMFKLRNVYCMRTLTRYSGINYMDQCITK